MNNNTNEPRTIGDNRHLTKKPWLTPKVTAAAEAEDALKFSFSVEVDGYYGPS